MFLIKCIVCMCSAVRAQLTSSTHKSHLSHWIETNQSVQVKVKGGGGGKAVDRAAGNADI